MIRKKEGILTPVGSALSVDFVPRLEEVREWMWFPGVQAESRALPSLELGTPSIPPVSSRPSMTALDSALKALRAHSPFPASQQLLEAPSPLDNFLANP